MSEFGKAQKQLDDAVRGMLGLTGPVAYGDFPVLNGQFRLILMRSLMPGDMSSRWYPAHHEPSEMKLVKSEETKGGTEK